MTETNWFSDSYRRNLIDMHIEDWDESFLSKFDPKAYVSLLKKAKVQSAMIYANSHVGYCYWPTASGHMHNGLKGRDTLGELIELCHSEGMDVVVYYSLIFNNWAHDQNPSWRMVNSEGITDSDRPGRLARKRKCCPNSLEYRDFIETQVKELCDAYDFEGIFFDMTYWPYICYCESCKQRYSKEVGGEMPTVADWKDPNWIRFQKKREEWLREFAAFATNVARRYKPGVTVEHNSAVLVHPWTLGTTLGLTESNDYIGGDLYGGFLQQSFVCKLFRNITPNQPFEYMTSRCDPSLSDHTTLKSKEALMLHACLALAHGGAFLFIDAIEPDGSLNPKVYETMGEVFGETSQYEPYLGGSMLEDVAVYYSLDSKMTIDKDYKQGIAGPLSYPHIDAALGATRILRENHIPFGVISRCNLKDTQAYKVIVLPDVAFLSDEEADAIREYVKNGGALFASGRSGAGVLADVLGVDERGETEENTTYVTPNQNGGALLPGIDPRFPLCVFSRQRVAEPCDQGEVMATITLPYTSPNDRKFVSIHSNPPGRSTEHPAVVFRRYGKGQVIWTAAAIEAFEQEPHRRAFADMIKALIGSDVSVEADAPGVVEVIAFHQPDNRRYLVALINEQESLPAVPVHGARIRVHMGGNRPTKAYLIPDERPLSLILRGDYAEVEMPELEVLRMFVIEY